MHHTPELVVGAVESPGLEGGLPAVWAVFHRWRGSHKSCGAAGGVEWVVVGLEVVGNVRC